MSLKDQQGWPKLGTDLCTFACFIALWSDSTLPWWLFAVFFFAGWAINITAFVLLRFLLEAIDK